MRSLVVFWDNLVISVTTGMQRVYDDVNGLRSWCMSYSIEEYVYTKTASPIAAIPPSTPGTATRVPAALEEEAAGADVALDGAFELEAMALRPCDL